LKFTAVSSSERILQIHQELTKLSPWLWWHPFLTHGVYAIACPSVCLSVVCNARAPYSGVEIFGSISTAFGTLAMSSTNFTEIVPEEPLRRWS